MVSSFPSLRYFADHLLITCKVAIKISKVERPPDVVIQTPQVADEEDKTKFSTVIILTFIGIFNIFRFFIPFIILGLFFVGRFSPDRDNPFYPQEYYPDMVFGALTIAALFMASSITGLTYLIKSDSKSLLKHYKAHIIEVIFHFFFLFWIIFQHKDLIFIQGCIFFLSIFYLRCLIAVMD